MLLVGNQHRGIDATGIAVAQADGSIEVYKKDDPAWKFVADEKFDKFLEEYLVEDTWAVLLHTRAATQGSPRLNKNNHPLCSGKSAVIHNGVLHNDDVLFRELKLERTADTDSDIIRAIIDKEGLTAAAMDTLHRLGGSAAGAALHPNYPQRMILFRSGSPMQLASNEDFFVFASEKNTIHRAMRPWVKRFGTYFQKMKPELDFAPMADNTSWLITAEEGVVVHKEFKTTYTYSEPQRRVFDNYRERQERWDRQSAVTRAVQTDNSRLVNIRDIKKNRRDVKAGVVEVWCPQCQKLFVMPEGKDIKDFTCPTSRGGCGGSLIPKPITVVVN